LHPTLLGISEGNRKRTSRSAQRILSHSRGFFQNLPDDGHLYAAHVIHDIWRATHGKAVVVPLSDKTRGHGTHSLPAIWGNPLARVVAVLKSEKSKLAFGT